LPTANLHIGAPKCASSLIQGLFNEPEAREILGGIYDPDLSREIQVRSPATDFSDPNYQKVLAELKEMVPDEDVLLSVENVFGMATHTPNSYSESVKVIDYLFDGFEIRIFMYVRRQDTFMQSMYNQDVKRGELRTFKGYMDEANLENIHWDVVADAYSAFDLTVRPFEKKVLETGGYKDFADAIFQWMGVKVEIDNLPVINPSLSQGALEVQRLANGMLSERQAYDLSCWMEKHCPKEQGEKHGLLLNPDFMKRYRKSNKRLFKDYMPGFDPAFYLGG